MVDQPDKRLQTGSFCVGSGLTDTEHIMVHMKELLSLVYIWVKCSFCFFYYCSLTVVSICGQSLSGVMLLSISVKYYFLVK